MEPCKQQEKNRRPVKGEIYRRAFVTFLNGLTKSKIPPPPEQAHNRGDNRRAQRLHENVKEAVVRAGLASMQDCLRACPASAQ